MTTDKTIYKVTAPYVTLKVIDAQGQRVLLGYYEGAVVPEQSDPDDLQRLVDKGMIAEEGTPEADAAVPHGVPVTFDDTGHAQPQNPTPEPESGDGKPKQVDAKDRWVDYRVSQRPEGQSEQDARAEAEAKSKADLIAGR